MKDEFAEKRAVRSVYVSNIPPDIHEEKMKDIFSSVGPVSSFRIIYDDAKRSRGYGYCEYLDKETALTAIMNFGGYELNGRTLMVESANNEKSIREIQAIIDEEAPETISKAVASLPPDQMFELLRQIKQCIENNVEEARAMLINNPSLTYALLEAQLVMGIVDLQEAWAVIEAAPLQKQDAVEVPHNPPTSAFRNAVTALNEAREAAENQNLETRNSIANANRHPLIDAFAADQSSRDSRTMDSSTTEHLPRLPQDSHIIDYNSDSRSMDDVITDAHPPLEARSRDTHPLIGDPQNIDIHSGDSHPPDQNSLAPKVDSRSGSSLIAEHFGADSHSRDSFPVISRSQNIEPQHVDPRMVEAQSVDRRIVDPRVVDRRPLDPRIVDRPVDPRIADRPPVDPRIADRPPVDPRIADRPPVDPRIAERPPVDPRIVERPPVDPRIADRPPVDPRIADRPPVDPRIADRPSVDPRISDRPSVDPRIADRPSIDPRIPDRLSVDPRIPDRPSVDPRIPDRPSIDPRIPDRPVDPRIPDRPSVDPRIAERHNVDPRIMEPLSQEPRAGDPRSLDPRPVDPRALYPRSIDPRADPRLGERRMDPRIGDWRLMEPHGTDPNSMDSDTTESHFDPRPGNPQFDNRSLDPRAMDPRAVQAHPPDPRNLNVRPMGPRVMDPRAVSSRPPDPFFTDPRNPRSRDANEMGPSMVDPRSQDLRMSHMGPDFRAPDPSRGYGGELHVRDPRLSRAGPQPVQPPLQPKVPATTAPGFPRSTISPRPTIAPAVVSHAETGNAGGAAPTTSDEEKAALIMQVLQLSDEQIAGLSPEQQQSILVLKEQIAKSTLQQ